MSEALLKALVGDAMSSLGLALMNHNSPRDFVKEELIKKINTDIAHGAKFHITNNKTGVTHEIYSLEDLNGHYVKLVALDDMGMRVNASVFYRTVQHDCDCTMGDDDEYKLDEAVQSIISDFFEQKHNALVDEHLIRSRRRITETLGKVTAKVTAEIGKAYHMDDPDCIFYVLKIDENTPSGVPMVGGFMIDMTDSDDDDFKIGAIPFYRLRGELKLE